MAKEDCQTLDRDDREAVLDLVRSAARSGREAVLQRMGREIKAAEMGIMLRALPEDAQDIILRNVCPDLRDLMRGIAGSECAVDVSDVNPSSYAPWRADTPEKSLKKYLAVYAGLHAAGELDPFLAK